MTTETKADRAEKKNGNGGGEILSRYEMDLPCALTSAEVLQRGDDAQKIYSQLAALRLEKKNVTDQINGRIKAKEGELSVLFQQIRERSEERSVSVIEVPDYRAGIVRVKREDTKQVVKTRELQAHERQPALKGIDGGKKPEKESKDKKKGCAPKLASIGEGASA